MGTATEAGHKAGYGAHGRRLVHVFGPRSDKPSATMTRTEELEAVGDSPGDALPAFDATDGARAFLAWAVYPSLVSVVLTHGQEPTATEAMSF